MTETEQAFSIGVPKDNLKSAVNIDEKITCYSDEIFPYQMNLTELKPISKTSPIYIYFESLFFKSLKIIACYRFMTFTVFTRLNAALE